MLLLRYKKFFNKRKRRLRDDSRKKAAFVSSSTPSAPVLLCSGPRLCPGPRPGLRPGPRFCPDCILWNPDSVAKVIIALNDINNKDLTFFKFFKKMIKML
ncbi:9985_t:CDS:2 [Gigaspora rosea]|nr:9985_t:CDS:2 [Gigaspora rosea]